VDGRRDDTIERTREVPAVAPDHLAPTVIEATDAIGPPLAPLPAAARHKRLGLVRLSPINERRWSNFKSNRRGYWSLWIFLALFIVSLFAEVIANDRPIVVHYKGEILFPILVDYPEEKFGGFLAVTDYKDPVVLDEIQKNGWMLWPPIRYSYSSINKDYPRIKGPEDRCLGYPAPPPWATSAELCDADPELLARFQAIGNRNWLGTDDQGRDVVARVIYGFRISVLFGLILTILASVIGVTAGAVQGYFGGRVDLVFQRVLEIWSSIPYLYVLIIISAVLAPGFWTLLFILLIFQWTQLVGVVRAEFLRGRNFEYITAARALGLSNAKIMFKHLLPNAMVATLTFLPFKLSGSIGALTMLDFLGLGLPPGSPSLGELLSQGKANIQAPWLGLAGFFSIAVTLSLLIFIGEAVRDALDPRKTFR
jgi:microcin C transport system permease protein